MFSFSMPELILVLVIALVVFGPAKLPEIGKAIGRSLQEFKNATNEGDNKAISVKTDKVEDKKEEEAKAEGKK